MVNHCCCYYYLYWYILGTTLAITVYHGTYLQHTHIDMQTAEHDHKVILSMCGWPGPLYFLGNGEEWLISSKYRYLSRVQVLNSCLDDGHGMSYHCHRVCTV